MSTPHVAGAAALILQNRPELKGNTGEVKRILKETAVNLSLDYDVNTQGGGRIDVLKAVSSDDALFIDFPYEIFEKECFKVSLSNKTGSPVKAFILFTVRFHLPKLKYGSTVTFKAPRIINPFKEKEFGKIIVFKFFSEEKVWKKDIFIINKK
jgi:hypothetical protein